MLVEFGKWKLTLPARDDPIAGRAERHIIATSVVVQACWCLGQEGGDIQGPGIAQPDSEWMEALCLCSGLVDHQRNPGAGAGSLGPRQQ